MGWSQWHGRAAHLSRRGHPSAGGGAHEASADSAEAEAEDALDQQQGSENRSKRKMRVFTPEQVEVLRKELREKSRLGQKPKLVGLGELARQAGCAVQTIRKRLGT